jgi:Pro-kumamolisin, activation domain/MBG domain (YGX type)
LTNTRSFRYLAGLIALACFATLTALAQSSETRRITQQIDENHVVTLQGHVIPIANAKSDRGPVEDSLDIDHMHLVLQRSPEKEKELNELMDEQNDKKSSNFHHWLTAEEFGERFGVAQEDIDAVTSWLESHGFRVNKVYTNRIMIDFSGNAGQLREAFHTPIHQLDLNGERHIANMSNPQIPAALAPVVKGIASLNDIKPKAMHERKYTFTDTNGTFFAVTPQDNQTIYGLNPLYASGISGQGQTIYLVEDTDTYGTAGSNGASDWNTYRSTFGLSSAFPSGSYTQAHPGGCADPGTNGDDGEAAIDVEVASGIAPSAHIELISCPSTTFTFGGQVALQNLINTTNPATPAGGVISVSYGLCEAFTGAGGNASFYNTYQQAAAEGYSVFVSSGDEGPSSCSNLFGTTGEQYDVASLGVTGWGETPFNVAVGGTDFEDTYNSKEANQAEGGGTIPVSTYWSSTNTAGFGSALSYIPEIPWNDACASVLLSEFLTGSFTPYGASPATCNNASFDTSTTFLSTGAGSGGASNCAIGAAGSNQSSAVLSSPECQGYPKPSWQSGSSLPGGAAVYGVPADGVRDIPDVSMFAANGVWGHYEVVCWSDPAQSAGGSMPCTGAPSTWAGFGGTSVAAPTMAAVQALVNQKTGETWGNPNPIYYQIGQSEYGTSGGTFKGSSCNSSGAGGPGSGCAFNDVTQGDIDLACEDNGTLEEAHCFKPAGTHGVDSTDNVTLATVINGGSGYTTAPTCTIAGPTNNQPYLSPAGTTLYAGGTQAKCTATVTATTTTAKWTIAIGTASAGQQITVGPNTYTLTGTSTTAEATALAASINTSTFATATSTTKTVTATAKVAGFAGNFNVSWAPGFLEGAANVTITNTTPGQGPNYVSAIAITTAGSGYQPETPITLTGAGSGAIAVANTSTGTAAQSYQPTYGAAPGYDLATGLGSPNANNLVNASPWYTPQTINFTTNAPSSAAYGSHFTVAATATSGLAVTFTSSGSCSNSGATYTMTSGTGTCSVIANQAGGGKYSAAPTVTQTVNATKVQLTVTANNASKAVGAPNPTFTASYTGFVNGQNSSVLSGAPSLTTTATTSSPAGTYPIVAALGTLSSANYSFTFVNGTLSVISAPTVVINASATLTGSASAGYTAHVTVTNTGTAAASNVMLTTATLGGVAGTPLPQTVGTGTLAANGGTATVTVSFPGTAGADGARSVETLGGTYTGGTFSASTRVVLP